MSIDENVIKIYHKYKNIGPKMYTQKWNGAKIVAAHLCITTEVLVCV